MKDAWPPSFEAAKAHVNRLARLREAKRAADHLRRPMEWSVGAGSASRAVHAARSRLFAAYDTVAVWIPILRGPCRCRLESPRCAMVYDSVHSIKSPANTELADVLRSVTMPPRESVKNSSTEGPTPSSGPRTVLLRQTPAATRNAGG